MGPGRKVGGCGVGEKNRVKTLCDKEISQEAQSWSLQWSLGETEKVFCLSNQRGMGTVHDGWGTG